MPWSTIIDFGLKVIYWLVSKYETDTENKKAFSEFITAREKRKNDSAAANKAEKEAFAEIAKQKETNTPK